MKSFLRPNPFIIKARNGVQLTGIGVSSFRIPNIEKELKKREVKLELAEKIISNVEFSQDGIDFLSVITNNLLDHTRWRSRHIDEYDSVLLNTIKSVLFLPILIVSLSEHQFFSMLAVGRIRSYLEKWNRPVEHKPGNSWLQKKLIF